MFSSIFSPTLEKSHQSFIPISGNLCCWHRWVLGFTDVYFEIIPIFSVWILYFAVEVSACHPVHWSSTMSLGKLGVGFDHILFLIKSILKWRNGNVWGMCFMISWRRSLHLYCWDGQNLKINISKHNTNPRNWLQNYKCEKMLYKVIMLMDSSIWAQQ